MDKNDYVEVVPLDNHQFSSSDFLIQLRVQDRIKRKRREERRKREMQLRREIELEIYRSLPIDLLESEKTKKCCVFI